MNKKYIVYLFVLQLGILSGQEYQAFYPQFYANGNRLEMATAGGLRNARFSNIDFNNDGVKDIYAFDKTSGRSLCFVNLNSSEGIEYRYAPEYEGIFPKIQNWALLHDFNKDGVEDIFCLPSTPGIPGIEVWRGKRQGNELRFELMKSPFYDVISIPAGNGFTNLYNAITDVPAIIDVDGDGDTDVLSFELDGSFLNYHQNRAVEKGLGLDTFVMETRDICFGKFYENMFSETVVLSNNKDQCASGLQDDGNPRHTGSTVLAFDNDCDGDMEVILGDVANTRLFMLTNGGNNNAAWMTSQDSKFPSYNIPVEMNLFIAAFLLDVNNDGKKDLIATPNETDGGINREHIWLYLNTGTACAPKFELYTKQFLVDEMVSAGAKSDPAIGDLTGDGLPDLLLGGNGVFNQGVLKKCRLNFYKNTGTKTQPEFTLQEEDYLNMSVLSTQPLALSPALADMDDDGDLDLWLGDGNGRLYFFTNTAGSGGPANFTYVYPYNNIFVGQDAKPCVRDVNGDGLLDLLVGEQNNELNLFLNTGTKNNPVFPSTPDQRNYGSLFSITDFYTFNNSIAPFENQGKRMAYIGFEDGRLSLYEWSGDGINGKWVLLDANVGKVHRGNKLNTELADVNADGIWDLVLGNFGGGVQFYTTPFLVNSSSTHYSTDDNIQIYPNPANDFLQVKSSEQLWLIVSDAQGKEVYAQRTSEALTSIDIKELPKGMYFVKFLQQGKLITCKKFIK
ncbi:MAG TPA: T9SS type A sorting domain-containing protein [Saprospiraceae bacterium]|nr:T9SS type A sorting domain-containing protein [Saprospiraceae bacterium]